MNLDSTLHFIWLKALALKALGCQVRGFLVKIINI